VEKKIIDLVQDGNMLMDKQLP